MSALNKTTTSLLIPKPVKGEVTFLVNNSGKLSYRVKQSLCYTNATTRLSRILSEGVRILVSNGSAPIIPSNTDRSDYPNTVERVLTGVITSTAPGVFTVTASIPATPTFSIDVGQVLLVAADDSIFAGVTFPLSYTRVFADVFTITFTIGAPVVSASIVNAAAGIEVDLTPFVAESTYVPYTQSGQLQPIVLGSNVVLETSTGDVSRPATVIRVGGWPTEVFTATFTVPDGTIVEGIKFFPYPQPGAAGAYAFAWRDFTPFTATDGVNDPVPFTVTIEITWDWV